MLNLAKTWLFRLNFVELGNLDKIWQNMAIWVKLC
jgi:hypothetical protein